MKNLRLILATILLVLPSIGWAQFTFTTNNGAITITGYNTAAGLNAVIPASTNGWPVTVIGTYAIVGSTITGVTIPNSITNIGIGAFVGCSSLSSVAIPNSVTNIGIQAFADCSSLTNITVDLANPSYVSAGGVLFDKSMATLLQCPAGLNGSYTVPNSVSSIRDDAFYFCSSLTSVTIPNSVTNIGNDAFDDCYSLKNAALPDGVINIGSFAFGACFGLTGVTIPDNVTTIGLGAFASCHGATNIAVSAANVNYASVGGVLFNKSLDTLVQFPAGLIGSYTVPYNVTNICDDAFFGCPSLHQVYFPGNAPLANGKQGSTDSEVFFGYSGTVYFLPGTSGWGSTFGGWPTAQWYQPQPQILGSAYGLGVQSNKFQFPVSWATNTSVVVEASTNLLTWSPVATNALVNGTNAFSDFNSANFSKRFYRVRSE